MSQPHTLSAAYLEAEARVLHRTETFPPVTMIDTWTLGDLLHQLFEGHEAMETFPTKLLRALYADLEILEAGLGSPASVTDLTCFREHVARLGQRCLIGAELCERIERARTQEGGGA